jgi:hypothetical protein
MKLITKGHWYDLTKNAKLFKRWPAKLNVVWVNAKNMFRRWIGNNKTLRAMKSIRAYFQLHKAGLRISNGPNEDNSFDIYRFYWKNKVINDICDIDRVNDKYYTLRAGHSEELE